MRSIGSLARTARSGACAATAAWVTLMLVSLAPGRATAVEATLTVVGGTGLLGETVGVMIQLSNDVANAAVSADLDIAYPADVVEFIPPVFERCRVAARLAATHQVGGTVPEPGLLRFAVFDATALDPLGDGELATCDFHILPDASLPTAALTTEFVDLAGAGGHIPVVGVGGVIAIPNVTPRPTARPTGCIGDCDGDARVTIDELIRGVRISLGDLSLDACQVFDSSADGAVSIAELISGVNRTLAGCSPAGDVP